MICLICGGFVVGFLTWVCSFRCLSLSGFSGSLGYLGVLVAFLVRGF